MVWLKIILVLVGLAVAALLAIKFTKETEGRHAGETQIGLRGWGAAVGVALFLLVLILMGAIGQVDAGHRGVVLNFGAVTSRTLGEGPYLVVPIVNSVEMMDVQTHAYEDQAGAASKDMQNVHTKVTLNYALDPTKVNNTYQTLRRAYVERIIKPAVQESVKATTARFNAEELITKRPLVKSEIELALKERLAVHGVLSETLSITDFTFDPLFTQSIEAKMVAAQDALKAENKLRQIEVEARQVETAAKGQANAAAAEADGAKRANITRAEGEKEAAVLRAEGQKQAAILEAEGQAQAILLKATKQADAYELIAKVLKDRPDLMKYVLYQTIGDDIKVIILPEAQPFILGSEVLGK